MFSPISPEIRILLVFNFSFQYIFIQIQIFLIRGCLTDYIKRNKFVAFIDKTTVTESMNICKMHLKYLSFEISLKTKQNSVFVREVLGNQCQRIFLCPIGDTTHLDFFQFFQSTKQMFENIEN